MPDYKGSAGVCTLDMSDCSWQPVRGRREVLSSAERCQMKTLVSTRYVTVVSESLKL